MRSFHTTKLLLFQMKVRTSAVPFRVLLDGSKREMVYFYLSQHEKVRRFPQRCSRKWCRRAYGLFVDPPISDNDTDFKGWWEMTGRGEDHAGCSGLHNGFK